MVKKVPMTRFPDAATVSYSRAIEKMITTIGVETLKLFEKHIVPQLQQDKMPLSLKIAY
ncbi:hypothetical protein ACH434_10005 [Lysinibacillus fusiformis]|uniref:hypothetical protein n=1 Tax=Lysinibacillus TaxID=400634 RepID=UPI001C3052F5|nr:hypothetical protein [Lysinibacillus sp. GbtcB16]